MFGDISGDLEDAGGSPVTLPVSIAAGGSFTCYYKATISGDYPGQPYQHGHCHSQRYLGSYRHRLRRRHRGLY